MTKDRFEWILDGLDDDKLTLWEAGFVESVTKFFEDNGFLTEGQEEKLEEIFRDRSR